MSKRFIAILLSAVCLLSALGVMAAADSYGTPELSAIDGLVFKGSSSPAAPLPTPSFDDVEFPDVDYTVSSGEETAGSSVFNVLLLGTDEKLAYTSDPGRSDSVMLASVNLDTGDVRLVSFERGIMVPVPPSLTATGVGNDLLTHAYRWGGAELMVSIMKDCFGIDVDAYIQADFEAFSNLIDIFGGYDVELTALEAYGMNNGHELESNAQAHNRIHEGMNHLDGYDTLVYARLRCIDDDWNRQQRQRNVMSWLIENIKNYSPFRLNRLVNKVMYFVDTDLTFAQIARLFASFDNIVSGEIQQLQIPDKNKGTNGYIHCDFPAEAQKIKEFIY